MKRLTILCVILFTCISCSKSYHYFVCISIVNQDEKMLFYRREAFPPDNYKYSQYSFGQSVGYMRRGEESFILNWDFYENEVRGFSDFVREFKLQYPDAALTCYYDYGNRTEELFQCQLEDLPNHMKMSESIKPNAFKPHMIEVDICFFWYGHERLNLEE